MTDIRNFIIIEGLSISNGAVFLFEQYRKSGIYNITADNCSAGKNGIIAFETTDESRELFLEGIKCKSNIALTGSCLYFNAASNITFSNAEITNCRGTVLKFFYEEIEGENS